jgi:hypothetical protein
LRGGWGAEGKQESGSEGSREWYRYLFVQRFFLHAVVPLADFVATQQFQTNDSRVRISNEVWASKSPIENIDNKHALIGLFFVTTL